MTDRELLELAAKAAGIGGKTVDDYGGFGGVAGRFAFVPYVKGELLTTTKEWNPLTDDGDALRLAVKLEMSLDLTIAMQDAADVQANNVDVDCNNDPYAATRRAIVRAAAEIGKGMK